MGRGGTQGAGGPGGPDGVGDPDLTPGDGPDAVLEAWRRATAAARMRGVRPGDGVRAQGGGRLRTNGIAPGSAHASGRDPQLIGDLTAAIVSDSGWDHRISVAGVMARWAEVVGDDVASRCTPERFDDGVLVVRAVTTAWATQLGYLTGDLSRRLADVVGAGVVERVEIVGPAAPSWSRGRLRVTGTRGPRDTYG